jgi:hypothetical protein
MGSVDLVPYWQVIVVTLETVIANIELADIIMQESAQNLDGTCIARVCLAAEVAAVQRWETAAQACSDRRPICRLPPWDMISRVAEALYTAILVVIAERKLVADSWVILALGELGDRMALWPS